MRHDGELELSEIHDYYINLRICGVCGQPHGPIALREPPSTQVQFCPCAVECGS